MAPGTRTDSRRALIAALAANVVAATAKFVGFAVSGSGGLLAEAVHSVADCGNQVLLLFGRRLADRPPTPRHPFGYGRVRYFWAFVVAEVGFGGGAVFAIADGIRRLDAHEHLHHLAAAAILLAASGVVELVSLAAAARDALHERRTRGWVAFLRESGNADLAILLVEDVTDILGVALALLGLLLGHLTGNPAYDAAAGIAIGGVLAVNAVVLAWEMASLLIGAAAPPDVEAAIVDAISAHPSVASVPELRTVRLGPGEILAIARVAFGTAERVADLCAEVVAAVTAAVPSARAVFVEPVSDAAAQRPGD